ncbi:hypothetical protein VTH06DRAFT_8821 [Thermothelomyces fergusii]
MSRYQ